MNNVSRPDATFVATGELNEKIGVRKKITHAD